mmetsp:Transcript_41425/g.102989  ORF Transcript_41425/g.102989 Transcript_41425/m.102989 type:complete len:203 (-) Transcript_41425:1141-1749(-)
MDLWGRPRSNAPQELLLRLHVQCDGRRQRRESRGSGGREAHEAVELLQDAVGRGRVGQLVVEQSDRALDELLQIAQLLGARAQAALDVREDSPPALFLVEVRDALEELLRLVVVPDVVVLLRCLRGDEEDHPLVAPLLEVLVPVGEKLNDRRGVVAHVCLRLDPQVRGDAPPRAAIDQGVAATVRRFGCAELLRTFPSLQRA